jgi:hypothetical protein
MTGSPVAEEAAKLFDAFQQWVAGASASIPVATESHECAFCPFCQVLQRARTARPELYEHLASAATELGAALRSLLDDPAGGRDDPQSARPSGGVEHIDIGE